MKTLALREVPRPTIEHAWAVDDRTGKEFRRGQPASERWMLTGLTCDDHVHDGPDEATSPQSSPDDTCDSGDILRLDSSHQKQNVLHSAESNAS